MPAGARVASCGTTAVSVSRPRGAHIRVHTSCTHAKQRARNAVHAHLVSGRQQREAGGEGVAEGPTDERGAERIVLGDDVEDEAEQRGGQAIERGARLDEGDAAIMPHPALMCI